MTIQDLGSIGELIAAIATIATLLYLAAQIRQHSRAARAEATRGSQDVDSATLAVAQDPELTRIFNAGLASFDALDPIERTRFAFIFGQMIGVPARIYDSYVTVGIMDEARFKDHSQGSLQLLETPGGSQFWRDFARNYPSEFREYVEREVNLRVAADQPTPVPAAQQSAAADSAQA